MNTADYFHHARKLAAFPADAALALAREAAALDKAAAERKVADTGPSEVWVESLPDGSVPLRFSRGIKVF